MARALLGVPHQLPDQDVGVEDVDPHRAEAEAGVPGGRRRDLGLLLEAHDAAVLVHLEDAEARDSLRGDLDGRDRELRAPGDVDVEHLAVVHLVDVVARQDDDPARPLALEGVEVLVDGVGGAEVPVLADALLGRQDLDELAQLGVHDAPAHADVAVQALGLVLGGDEDLPEAGVDAVGEREVDDPVGAAEGDRGLGAVAGQGIEPLARAPRQEHRHDVAQQKDVHPGRPVLSPSAWLRHIRVLSTTRAGEPSAPTIRSGRHAMSYSPGSTSERSRPSTITTPAPSSAWWAAKSLLRNRSIER